ncbi:hypothetical protein RCH12_002731 [Cryobacterium sp. MP_3.1]|uniref:hypothetical protein n=1 Tax=Cryobacterium sp. MP_3.1 TaxID=3071711 RepID=UPI002DFFACAD|nr:hypothetical protein [Cryobacterium sp. MP_3.1]
MKTYIYNPDKTFEQHTTDRALAALSATVGALTQPDGRQSCLITQVHEAAGGASSGDATGSSAPHLRSPANASALDLYQAMERAGRSAMQQVTGEAQPRSLDPQTALTTWLTWISNQATTGAITGDDLDFMTGSLRGLVNRSHYLLAPPRRIEVCVRCPSCDELRQASNGYLLGATLPEGRPPLIDCAGCGAEWKGLEGWARLAHEAGFVLPLDLGLLLLAAA